MSKKEYFCCALHHSSYCPECRGEICDIRLRYPLSDIDWREENEQRKDENNDKSGTTTNRKADSV